MVVFLLCAIVGILLFGADALVAATALAVSGVVRATVFGLVAVGGILAALYLFGAIASTAMTAGIVLAALTGIVVWDRARLRISRDG